MPILCFKAMRALKRLSNLGGCIQVVTIFILAYPEYQKSHNKKQTIRASSSTMKHLMPGHPGPCEHSNHMIRTSFNCRACTRSAQLIFNMICFGSLGIDEFPKDVKIGTYVVVSGAFLLPIVGPTVQQGQAKMSFHYLKNRHHFYGLWFLLK